ncbi:MAG: hypothetical protein WAV89_13150 [Ignavibacteriaceae bacterium]
MTPSESSEALVGFASQRGINLASATPGQGIEAMIHFFREIRPGSPIVEGAGDMLLFQWGVYRFSGSPSFQLNLTRQFIELVEEEGEDEEVMSQLGLTFHFPAAGAMEAFGEQNRWCESLAGVDDFVAFITKSAPYMALKDARPEHIEAEWSLV